MLKTAIFVSLPIFLLLMLPATAHPGRTDANGCHTNRRTGEYHCHHSSNPLPASPSSQINSSTVVISVGDGDTIRVKDSGKTITVRLACVDAPETRQTPWGIQATNRLKQLLPAGQPIRIRAVDTDRYGRTVGEVFKDNKSINLKLVKEGYAVVYRQYLGGCSSTQNQYLQAEARAKQQRLGFWNQAKPVMPWDFRRGRR